MAKNSGRRKGKSRSSKREQPTIAKWLWILTLLIIGGLVTFLLVVTRSTTPEKQPSYPVNSTPPAGSEKPKPKFEFYEMLPNKQVSPPMEMPLQEPVPEEIIEKPPEVRHEPTPPPAKPPQQKPQTPKPAEAPPVTKVYWVQIGAFQKFDEADQLKAEMTLMGFPVVIQSVNADGNLLFKVRSGPYADKTAAVAAQNDLIGSGFAGNIIQE